MLDVNCGAKTIHFDFLRWISIPLLLEVCFVKKFPKVIYSDIAVAESESKPRRNITSDMVFGNYFVHEQKLDSLSVFVRKIKERRNHL